VAYRYGYNPIFLILSGYSVGVSEGMNPESPEAVMLFSFTVHGWKIVSPPYWDVYDHAGTHGVCGRKIQIRWVCPD